MRWPTYDPASGAPPHPAAVKAFVAVVSGLACGASAVLARLTGGRLALAAIAPLAVFHFGHTVQGTVANTEALYGLLLAALLSSLVQATRHSWLGVPEPGASWLGAVAASGALAGCAAVARAEFLLGTALVGILIFGAYRLRRRAPPMAWLFTIPVVTLLASTWLFDGSVRLVVAYLPVLGYCRPWPSPHWPSGPAADGASRLVASPWRPGS